MSDNSKKVDENIIIEGDIQNSSGILGIVEKYGGAIIGGIIAVLLCFTHLYKLVLAIVIVLGGIFIGNYVQKNKDSVKEKLKELIDKF